MPAGYWCPVLHAHLPYVRHPEHASFLEEDWFFEALTETYVPLVRVLDGLLNDGVEYRLTMTLSPPLVSMMTDELLVGRYHRHLDNLVELARREVDRTKKWQPQFHDLAWFYLHELSDIRRVFREVYGSNLVSAFRKHRDAGKLEIITCGATHGFFPLMDPVPQAVRAQVQVAAHHYRKHFGRSPDGIWLPECGYTPGHEVFLKEAGLRFSFLEAHGLDDAHPRPELRRPRPDRLPWRDRLLRPRHGVLATGLERGVGLPRRLRLPRVLQGRRAGSFRWGTSRTSCPTARGRTSASSTTA